jgi:hypothetical protein
MLAIGTAHDYGRKRAYGMRNFQWKLASAVSGVKLALPMAMRCGFARIRAVFDSN